jgi:3-oxoacyl-[acyl-carrier protein] reductase
VNASRRTLAKGSLPLNVWLSATNFLLPAQAMIDRKIDMNPMKELSQRTALVTGAAGSIGAAIARTLAADGHRLILVDIELESSRALASELATECYPVAIDLSRPEQIAEKHRQAADEFGPADILVNNAGVLSKNKLLKTDLEEWRKVFAVNLDGPFVLSQQALSHMIDQCRGRIVNIASFAWKSGASPRGRPTPPRRPASSD